MKDFLTVLALIDDRRQSCLATDLRAGGRLRNHPHELFQFPRAGRLVRGRGRRLNCVLSTPVMIMGSDR